MSTHDFVVIGGGTAGCVIATRLSEDPDVSVLLLEAGGDERRPDVEDPAAWRSVLHSGANWGFESVVQPTTGHAYPAHRGKVLGGSGSINNLTHLRGHRYDFDEWARLGALGWAYDDVLPYFKRSEHVPDGDPRYRGLGGPLHPNVDESERTMPHAVAYLHGAKQAGHELVDDFNAAEMLGAGHSESLVVNGRRESTASAYLRPVIGRPNLTVVTGAHVLSLVVRSGRCVGARYVHDGDELIASASEVVLSAGAVGSPHLLMLSGIGPPDVLAGAGVEPAYDLWGVGRNLQDHILLAGIRYRADRPFGDSGMGGTIVLARTDGGEHGPDLHLAAMNIDYHLPWQDPAPNSLTLGVGHMRPRSRGEVRLVSADPIMPPAIDPAYVSEASDLEQLIAGVEMVDEIVRTGVLDEWGGSSDTSAILALDRTDLEQVVRESISSYFHLSGTCRMGSDDEAVVDPTLRVHGIEGLRVADASVMPTVVSCNTNAASVMIGEKASDLLRGLDHAT